MFEAAALFALSLLGLVKWPAQEHVYRLPDSHTITGLVRDRDGTWWAGNDGRMFEGDSFRPGVVHLTSDFHRISEFKVPGKETLQGVTLVGSEVWAAYYPTSSLERFSRDGKHLGSVHLGGHPNGLAFDGQNLLVSFDKEKAIEWRTREGKLLKRVSTLRAPDQLSWYGGKVWYSTGANGHPGCVFSLAGDKMCFHQVTAIEGFGFAGGTLAVASDGYFHVQTPKQNRVTVFSVPS